jgi:hypothetical protein
MPGRYGRPLFPDPSLLLSSLLHIPWHISGGAGEQMAVTVQMQFESVVTELYQDAFVDSSIEKVLIRYHFDYESAQIWRSEVLETSRHGPSVRRPCQGFDGTTWAGRVPRRVVPDQAEVRANSCAAGQSWRRPGREPRAASSGCDPSRSFRFCGPKAPRHDAGCG